ncbi:MAG: xylosidase [Planctomycetota bacterium]|nr:MAG: xylosidase [Planctomycetota bacterium]
MNRAVGCAAFLACSWILLLARPLQAAQEFHVAPHGNDAHSGDAAAPFRTIQRAADAAQPGDVVTVHAGVYRESVNPPRGGESDARRIVYQAAPGETVEIRGSEVIKDWMRVDGDVWKTSLPNSFFGSFNPFGDLIRGDWFNDRGRPHHTGAVYLNGQWLVEAATLDDVMQPAGAQPLWFAEAGDDATTIWAQFKGVDPNREEVEINVRQTVFYPRRTGVNYITLRGFTLRHAATPWAPPTAEQIGLVGTNWSKGWIIEDNRVSHSTCVGITLGKYGDQWDNTSADTAEGYVKTIERALASGWNKETVGSHIVRNNVISHCEQAGIVGSLGAVFSEIRGNVIHDVHVRRLFTGAEMAGIKLHAAVDVTIENNRVYSTCLGLWLDWMAQGTRVSRNSFHDNGQDVFVEVNHGPFLLDNNLLLSHSSLLDMSQGGAYAHNLFAGSIVSRQELGRQTPHLAPHGTAVVGLQRIRGGDNRFYNNIFLGEVRPVASPSDGSLAGPASPPREQQAASAAGADPLPLHAGGNAYYREASPLPGEAKPEELHAADPQLKIMAQPDQVVLELEFGEGLKQITTRAVTTELLGPAAIPQLPYEHADGAPLTIGADYFGKARDALRPTPGPFEGLPAGRVKLTVW